MTTAALPLPKATSVIGHVSGTEFLSRPIMVTAAIARKHPAKVLCSVRTNSAKLANCVVNTVAARIQEPLPSAKSA